MIEKKEKSTSNIIWHALPYKKHATTKIAALILNLYKHCFLQPNLKKCLELTRKKGMLVHGPWAKYIESHNERHVAGKKKVFRK